MKGLLHATHQGWFVRYAGTTLPSTELNREVPLHPDSQTWMDGYNLYEGKQVQFVMLQGQAKLIEEEDEITIPDNFQIGPDGAFNRLEINKDELYKLYMKWVDEVTEECDWKTSFGPEEIVHSIANILETNPHLINNEITN
jgi:hypothetical protein